MDDNDLERMVYDHDKHLDQLTNNISSLTDSVKTTNTKLDDVISVITQQNVLAERLAAIDREVTEAFNRTYTRIDKLEVQLEDRGIKGCNTAQMLSGTIGDIQSDVKEASTINTARLVKAVGGVLMLLAAALTYVMYDVHRNTSSIADTRDDEVRIELQLKAHTSGDVSIWEYTDRRLERLEKKYESQSSQ